MDRLPPKWLDRFLQWYCKPKLLEEIVGDLHELYSERLESRGKLSANAWYGLDVIRFFRRSNLRFFQGSFPGQNSTIMVESYFKIAYRNLLKNPLSTVINLLGLTIAVAYGIRAYAHIQWLHKVDQFHENKKEVFLATHFSDREGNMKQYGNVPIPMAQSLVHDVSGVERASRVQSDHIVAKRGDKVFYETIRYVDPSYLEMLTFPMKWGAARCLYDQNSIVISEDMALKYFGSDDPVGENILLIFGPDRKKTFVVGAVAAPFPSASTMHFDFLIPFENLRWTRPEFAFNDWTQLIAGTLVQTSGQVEMAAIRDVLRGYAQTYNDNQRDEQIAHFQLESIDQAYWKKIEDKFSISYLIEGPIVILSTVAMFLLILSSLNYTNIAIFTATKRLKEIGLRKAIGAGRRMIISQFLLENIFVGLITIILGFILAKGYIVPEFEKGIGVSLGLELFSFQTFIFLACVLLLISFLSGFYPAFYVSKFQTAAIFRGNSRFGKRNKFTKVFLSIQLILAAITITFATMTFQNAAFIKARSWGYSEKDALYLEVPDPSTFGKLKASLQGNDGIQFIAGANDHLGASHREKTVSRIEEKIAVNWYETDADYFETLGLSLTQGRFFRKSSASDLRSIVVNETFIANTGMVEPLGKQLTLDSVKYEIVGVLKDFHAYNFEVDIVPTIFTLTAGSDFHYLVVKGEISKKDEILAALKERWTLFYAEIPFQGGLQEAVWGNVYWSRLGGGQAFFSEIAVVCILLVALGLYGLITLNIGGRIKEFSIRKVLGAEGKNVIRNIIRPYLGLFAVALTLGVPVSYLFVDLALGFIWSYHVPINFVGISLAIFILVTVLVVVVLMQTSRVIKANPAKGLRAE